MNYLRFFLSLKSQFPSLLIKKNFPLAPLTTLKIGGPADIFIQTSTNQQLIKVLKYIFNCRSLKSPITILGNGSNVLISDSGIRGIVIKNTSSNIKILNQRHPELAEGPLNTDAPTHHLSTRHAEYHPKQYLSLKNKDYDESDCPQVLVQLDAGTPLPYAIDHLIKKGITGLQWFAYIPGQIGGAIWYNIHGGNHHISEYIHKITLYNQRTQKLETIPATNFKWNYDTSPFQSKPH
ncbi:FAD-binding protein, partial [Patescibacteria group bacterium]|nr:FAD-binding protein [Patescibacteria group bacterium]